MMTKQVSQFQVLTSARGLCGVFSRFNAMFASALIVDNEQ